MLDRASRYYVERVRGAQTVTIIVNEGGKDELRIRTQPKVRGIKKLAHDLALGLQDYFNIQNRTL